MVREDGKAAAEFVGEPLLPVSGTADTKAMSRGEPGLPGRFVWRERTYEVAAVVATWKTSGPCHSGSGERYLRRHWYRVLARPAEAGGREAVMTVYCERQARSAKRPKARWFAYTVEPAGG